MRNMKVHVYGPDKLPLVWDIDIYDEDGHLIDFETVEEAEIFLETAAPYYPNLVNEVEEIVEDIMYYDGGYIPGALALEFLKKEIEQRKNETARNFKQKIISILEARYNMTTNIVNVEGFEEEVEAAAKDAGIENFHQNFWCVTETEDYTAYSYSAMWMYRNEYGFFNDIIEVYKED